MRVLICAGEQTKNIVNKLEMSVGGIELIGCKMASDIKKTLLSSGQINKVIIFESAYDIEDVDFLAEQLSINTIFIMTSEEKMKRLDIKYFINENVFIIDHRNKTLNLLFLKNLIIESTIEQNLLFNVEKKDEVKQEEQVQEEQPVDEGPRLVRRVAKSEDEEEETQQEEETVKKPKLESLVKPKRETHLDKEATPIFQKSTKDETPGEKLKRIVNMFSDGCVIGMIGLPKSYSTTTSYNFAQVLAKNNITTLLVDLDTMNVPIGCLNHKLFSEYSSNLMNNNLRSAIAAGSFVKFSYLHKTNLHVVSSSLCSDNFNLREIAKQFSDMIANYKIAFNVIILDLRLEDVQYNWDIINLCNKIVFSVPMTNKDLFYFMRHIETIEDEKIRNRVFDFGSYISIDDTKKKLLETNKTGMDAIDDMLAKEFNIINEKKYVNINKVGEIITENKLDYLEKEPKINEELYIDTLLNILERKKVFEV